jgi:hypothetical protein
MPEAMNEPSQEPNTAPTLEPTPERIKKNDTRMHFCAESKTDTQTGTQTSGSAIASQSHAKCMYDMCIFHTSFPTVLYVQYERYIMYVRTVQYRLLTPFLVKDLSVGMKVSAIFVNPYPSTFSGLTTCTQCRVTCDVCCVRCAVCQRHMPSADGSRAEKRPTRDPTAKRTKKIKEEKKGQKCWGMDRLDESF